MFVKLNDKLFKVIVDGRNTNAGALTFARLLVPTKDGLKIKKTVWSKSSKTGHHWVDVWVARVPFVVVFFDRTNSGHTNIKVTKVNNDTIDDVFVFDDGNVLKNTDADLAKKALSLAGLDWVNDFIN